MLHIIYNPIAGKGRSERFQKVLAAQLTEKNIAHRFYITQNRRDAIEIARTITRNDHSESIDIIAMGGDGTLNEVLNGLEDPARTRLGIIPCGSGNDFAAAANIPSTPEGALDVLLNHEAKYTDYMECSGIRGINVIGMGIDVDILRRHAKMKVLKGSISYLAASLLTLLNFNFYKFSEEKDGKLIPHSALIACAGNGRFIGGGIPICPKGILDDGLLDIVIIDNIKKRTIPSAFINLMRKKILELPYTLFMREQALCLKSTNPLPIQIDGEIYEDLPFNVSIVHKQLRVYRP